MSGQSSRHYLPPRPVPAGYGVRHNTPAAERAAAIAAEDAARAATHAVPHVHLGTLGTTTMFRERHAPALADFGLPKPIPAGFKSPRRPVNGKPPR